nr:hypothetical protein [Candidatus Polarisedimenticolia bacterium]
MSDRALRELREDLIAFMRQPGYRPAALRDLIRLLRVERARRNDFKRILRDLINESEVVKVDRHRFAAVRRGAEGPRRPAAAGSGTLRSAAPGGTRAGRNGGARSITGRLQRNPRGFGFVTPDAGGPDLFIPGRALGDLMDGDRVAVRVVRDDGRGRAEAEVLRVLERSRKRILGIYRS